MPRYRIHQAAQAVGVSTQLLRAWERRYGLLSPTRTESGYRLYSDEEIRLLRATKTLVERGHSISEVAKIPEEKRILAAQVVEPNQPVFVTNPFQGNSHEAALTAIKNFDRVTLETALFHATGMGTFSPQAICDHVLMPLLAEIGNRWEHGKLSIAAEHFGSLIVRQYLQTLLGQVSPPTLSASPIVCACLEGEMHEGGLLAFAIHAATLGWPVIYLGPHTPIRDIVATAEHEQAQGIALSMTMPITKPSRSSFLAPLSTWKKKNSSRFVLFGGKGAQRITKALHTEGLDIENTLHAIPRFLSNRNRKKPNQKTQ